MPGMSDTFKLERFMAAQDPVYGIVREELRRGRKTGHWMWFVFPQIAGLGRSAMAQHFAISGAEEARAYLAHRILGARLYECTGLVSAIEGKSAEQIFGSIDAIKFRSSMTLFARAAQTAEEKASFVEALAKYYGGEEDGLTVQLLASLPSQ